MKKYNATIALIAGVLATACGDRAISESELEGILRKDAGGKLESVKIHTLKKLGDRPDAETGCNPMFDKSTYAVHITTVSDQGKCPMISTLQSVCGPHYQNDINICLTYKQDRWIYTQGGMIIPHAVPADGRP